MKNLIFSVVMLMASSAGYTRNSYIIKDTIAAPVDYKFDKNFATIPTFEIEISLSPKAAAKLASSKETIIVMAYFSGIPKDTTLKYFKKWGEIDITSHSVELKNSFIARFENIKFPISLYHSLADKDIHLLINVYSGRRVFKDNLLNSDLLEDKMSNVQNRKFILKAKLIYGE